MAVLADGGDPLITSAPYIFVPENTDAAFYAATAITLAGGPAPLDDAVEAFDPDGLFQFDNNTAGRLPALLVNGPAAGDVLALRTNGTPCNLPFPQSPDLIGWQGRGLVANLRENQPNSSALDPTRPDFGHGTAAEGTRAVVCDATLVNALGRAPPESAITWAISGADAARFDLDPATGRLRFHDAPDFEAPADTNATNQYSTWRR